jgi:DNA (cytosine-5)-methyltransferase 1
MKYLSLFSGIGAFEKALNNINIDYKLEGFSEIDKYAIKSYCTIHDVDESLNLGDITQIDIEKLPTDIDLITHGSPCQDFSVAGTNKGGDEGTNTRSSLMWNTVEIVKHCKPKYVRT